MKKIIVLLILSFILPSQARAIYDPLSVPNNKFGIHIINESDLLMSSALVNSSGGEWGYVTLVIPENERNIEKWNGIFDQMKKFKLIPIIRIASLLEYDTWKTPDVNQAENWAQFLNSLKWYTKNRYIILFNEPNHAKEWGGQVNPRHYAEIILEYGQKIKNKSSDFFILPSGLDASAPDSSYTMDEVRFLKSITSYKREMFDILDGWTSHSYPNPHFMGRVNDTGRGTLTTFEWELSLLNQLGIYKKYPVFITETGWVHNQDNQDSGLYSPDYVAGLIEEAAKSVWNNSKIVAVTPFLLNYQSYPFAGFSWQKLNSKYYYPQFDSYRSVAKIKGLPELVDSVEVNKSQLTAGLNISENIQIEYNLKTANLVMSFFTFLTGKLYPPMRYLTRLIS